MPEPELKQLIEFSSTVMGEIFAEKGVIHPMWHVILGNKEHQIIPMPRAETKDAAVAIVRLYFAKVEARAYVFISEAWSVTAATRDLDLIMEHGAANHPQRQEVVFFQAEDQAGSVTAERPIVRPASGPPHLGPLRFRETMPIAEGRLVGMLPRAKDATLQ